MGDADGSYDFRDLMPFLERLRAGADLVMGNRFAGGIKPGAMPRLNRYLGNPILSWLGRLLFDCPIHDFHSGLREFSRVAFDRMNLQTTGMEYASEMVIKATLLGMRLEEVPIVLSPDGRSRGPHLQRWRDGWRHLRFMLIYSSRWLFLYPGMVLMAVGLAALMWLLPGPRQVGGVIFDVHHVAVLVGGRTGRVSSGVVRDLHHRIRSEGRSPPSQQLCPGAEAAAAARVRRHAWSWTRCLRTSHVARIGLVLARSGVRTSRSKSSSQARHSGGALRRPSVCR